MVQCITRVFTFFAYVLTVFENHFDPLEKKIAGEL